MRDKEILVTGGAGFIGSHLVESLARKNEVVVIDNLSQGIKANLDEGIKLRQIDVTDRRAVQSVFAQNSFDIVFHLASKTNVSESVKEPGKEFDTSLLGTRNMLEASREACLEKIVFTSSASVYGDSNEPLSEKSKTNPQSPYSAFKLLSERLGITYKNIYETPFVITRLSNIYGPRQRSQVIYDFMKKLDKNPHELKVLGTGRQVRNFCHVEDVVNGLILCAEKGITGEIYNLAGDEDITISELAKKISSMYSGQTDIKFTESSWEGDIEKLKVDNSKIKQLGFRQHKVLEEGLRDYKDWYERRNKTGL